MFFVCSFLGRGLFSLCETCMHAVPVMNSYLQVRRQVLDKSQASFPAGKHLDGCRSLPINSPHVGVRIGLHPTREARDLGIDRKR
jgi:hypothetical protein